MELTGAVEQTPAQEAKRKMKKHAKKFDAEPGELPCVSSHHDAASIARAKILKITVWLEILRSFDF